MVILAEIVLIKKFVLSVVEHSLGDCQSNFVKCSNCLWSNKKYGMALKVDHTTWDHNQCETLKRFEKIQNDKYNK